MKSSVSVRAAIPAHPQQPAQEAVPVPAMDAAPERWGAPAKTGKGLFGAICLGSLVSHAAVFSALLLVASVAIVPPPEEALDEAGDTISVIMRGDSDLDQQSAGEEAKSEEPQPETVTAEAVQPETVQPAQPEVLQASVETVVTPEPEVVTSTVQAETAVVQPQAMEAPETVQPAEQAVKPVEKPPAPKPPAEKPKNVKKQPPRPVKTRSGSKGGNDRDSRKGSMDGVENAHSDATSQSAAARTGTGTADNANYKGKLGASLSRCLQRLPRRLRENGTTIRIGLVVDGSGNVSSVRATSGAPELDSAAAGLVSRCRVPSLPPEMGQAKSFVQPVQIL